MVKGGNEMTFEQAQTMAKKNGATIKRLSEVSHLPTVAMFARNVIRAHGHYTCTIGDKRVIVVAD